MIALASAAWSLLSGKMKAAVLAIGGFLVGAMLVFLVMTVVYDGVRLPLIGQLIPGRVQTAVKDATASLVARAEYDALAAVLARRELEAQTAAAAAAALRGKITQAERAKADAEMRLQNELAADHDPGRATVNDADLRWMSKH